MPTKNYTFIYFYIFQVEVLIIDLEKANGTARELQKRTEQLERVNIEIKSRLEETIQIYEQTQRDLRIKVTEIQRISHELDKTREQKDALGRENKKLGGKLRVDPAWPLNQDHRYLLRPARAWQTCKQKEFLDRRWLPRSFHHFLKEQEPIYLLLLALLQLRRCEKLPK